LDEDWGRRKRDKPKVEESGANRVCYFEKATVLENQWQASENIEKLKLGYAGNISEIVPKFFDINSELWQGSKSLARIV